MVQVTRQAVLMQITARPAGPRCAQGIPSQLRSGLMRLRGDLHKVDMVIAQMSLDNMQHLVGLNRKQCRLRTLKIFGDCKAPRAQRCHCATEEANSGVFACILILHIAWRQEMTTKMSMCSRPSNLTATKTRCSVNVCASQAAQDLKKVQGANRRSKIRSERGPVKVKVLATRSHSKAAAMPKAFAAAPENDVSPG